MSEGGNIPGEEIVDSTARLEIHAGHGSEASIQIYLCVDGRPGGVFTFGDDTIRWATSELAAIDYTHEELAAILEEHGRRSRRP